MRPVSISADGHAGSKFSDASWQQQVPFYIKRHADGVGSLRQPLPGLCTAHQGIHALLLNNTA